MMLRRTLAAAALAALVGLGSVPRADAQAVQCPVRMGGVLSLTGSMAAVGRVIADAATLAVEQVNAAGGVHGCQIEFLLRDDQNSPQVGVDAAKNLVDVSRVPVLIGSISSGVTLPILTSVAVPNRVTMISCCSTSPTFTRLAAEGQSQGYFFRTLPTAIVQAITSAKIGIDRGWRRVTVLYVNTDFGVALARDFQRAMQRLGGEAVALVPFNENQPSYRAEVGRAMAVPHDAMYLIGFPGDGATLAREWISLGGTQQLLLNNALRADEFIRNVGARFLNDSWGMDNAQVEGPSVDQFNRDFQARFNRGTNSPGLHTVYDAVIVAALAMQSAAAVDGTQIRDQIRRVTGHAEGMEVNPGVESLRRGLAALRAGQRIRYVGATGPVSFDANGDVAGPALVWRIQNGALQNVSVISVQEMGELIRRVTAN